LRTIALNIGEAFLKGERNMFTGTVKRIMRDKGFGFISATDGREVFFHRSEVKNVDFDELREGDHLEFGVTKGKKGPQAVDINRVSEETV
jgi:CspA family cold shock protein